MNRTAVAFVWVVWTVSAIVLYFTGPTESGALALIAKLWWENWGLVIVVWLVLGLFALAPWRRFVH